MKHSVYYCNMARPKLPDSTTQQIGSNNESSPKKACKLLVSILSHVALFVCVVWAICWYTKISDSITNQWPQPDDDDGSIETLGVIPRNLNGKISEAGMQRQLSTLLLHVHPLPVTWDEANEIVNKKGGPFSDAKTIGKDDLTEFERSLSRDVNIDPNESITAVKHLLGTNLFWTDIDHANGERINSGHWHWQQCYSPEYYERFFKSHVWYQKYRLAVETTCTGHKSSSNILTRTCRSTCLTLIPDDPSSKHLVAYYKNEQEPTINLNCGQLSKCEATTTNSTSFFTRRK